MNNISRLSHIPTDSKKQLREDPVVQDFIHTLDHYTHNTTLRQEEIVAALQKQYIGHTWLNKYGGVSNAINTLITNNFVDYIIELSQ